jgi:hypothetical protein
MRNAGTVVVTRHAAERFAERVSPCSLTEAEEQIHSHDAIIRKAASFGARSVKLGSNHRLILSGLTVVTVYPAKRIAFGV